MDSATPRPGRTVWTSVCVLFAKGVTVGTVLAAPSLRDTSSEVDVSDGPFALLALLDCRASSSTIRLGVPLSVGCVPLLVSILIISTVVVLFEFVGVYLCCCVDEKKK